ncbi:MAG: bifunctional diaminohydroxyphosphoribosylaminopyrimidine deaminase/5-amino-6-(5-phosphoribosylamino)uracil reductase RibD [Actinomycetota bacterium]
MDEARQMRRALHLAERGWGRVSPNPLVGALVIRGGEVLGEGWHEGPGTAHAEVVALGQAGSRARGSTLFSSLEPCDRYGRTPPCTRAVIDAGVARVVVATSDPNLGPVQPGIAALRAAGIEVDVGLLREEAERQNAAFLTHVRTGLPAVTLKMAMSLDGRSAARDGSSRWITGEEARADVQRLRAWADAIVVGAGTALADDPALTVRDPRFACASAPLRVVVSASGRLPATGHLFEGPAPTLVATTERSPDRSRSDWEAAGAEVQVCEADATGGVSLPALVAALGKRDVQGVLLEGGPTLAWSAIRDGVVDRVVFYIAPILLGGTQAPSAVEGAGFAPIAAALRLTPRSMDRFGEDLRWEGDVHRHR